MRVAVVSESFLPHVNGVTGSVLQVLRHLRSTGHDARVIAPGDPPPVCEGFQVVGLPSVGLPGYSQVRLPLVVTRTLVRELTQFAPDVVHLASPFVLGGPVVRAAASLDIPVVAIYQTDVAGFARRYGLTAASNAAWRRIRSIHERAQVTLAPSPTAARHLEGHGVPRVRVWPRGVDTTAFSPAHRDARWRARLAPAGEVLVGYFGRLAAEKQVEDLAVLGDMPGVRLVVIGDGPERERLTQRLPGAHFLGVLSGRDLSRAVASLDVVVHPGPYETFCQAAQEAMASGVPVVAVGSGGLLDLVDSSRTGWLYRPGDLQALRGHVADLVGTTPSGGRWAPQPTNRFGPAPGRWCATDSSATTPRPPAAWWSAGTECASSASRTPTPRAADGPHHSPRSRHGCRQLSGRAADVLGLLPRRLDRVTTATVSGSLRRKGVVPRVSTAGGREDPSRVRRQCRSSPRPLGGGG